MKLHYELGMKQVRRHGEELCGDSIAVSRHSDSLTLALSDGLGSGVKANILATLTTRIATHLLENGLPLTEVEETLGKTLPVCQVRKLAYSTFAIAQFFQDGYVRVVEFDTPETILLRDRKLRHLGYTERHVGGKTIRESVIDLELGDWAVLISDGVLNAGENLRPLLSANVLGAVAGIAGGIALIPPFGLTGAAAGSAPAEVVAELVVLLAFLHVREHLVGSVHLLEFLLCRLVPGIHVRMELPRLLPEGLLYLLLCGIPVYPKDLVEIFLCRSGHTVSSKFIVFIL